MHITEMCNNKADIHVLDNQQLLTPNSGRIRFLGTLGTKSMIPQIIVRMDALPHA